MTASSAKIGVIGSIIAILVLTVLEFPSPIGFETRPQGDVSMFWLLFFLIILVTEIAAIPLILAKPTLGRWFGVIAAILNILQVIADQLHLIQPEVAPFNYSLLEYAVALASIALVYFSLKVHQQVIALT